jgi:hypothetical protein
MGKYTGAVEDHLILPARVRLTPGQEHRERVSGSPIPPPVPVRLLIDTGARRTTLIPGIVRHLNPIAERDVYVNAPLASGEATLYWLCLEFPGTGLRPFPAVLVARLPMPPGLSQFHGLLGRDLLSRLASFEYEGQRARYSLRDKAGLFGWLRRWL